MVNNKNNELYANNELIKYLLNQRENKIWLENSNIILQHDPKRVPYIHSLPNSTVDKIYIIENKTHEIDKEHEIYEYEYTTNGSKHLDFLVGTLVEMMAFYDTFDAWAKQPKKPVDEKVGDFLHKHLGITYQEFTQNLNYKEITGEGFDSLGKGSIKKQLFDFRAKAYLIALASAEEKGYTIKESIKALANTTIVPIKKQETEPVLEYIKQKLAD